MGQKYLIKVAIFRHFGISYQLKQIRTPDTNFLNNIFKLLLRIQDSKDIYWNKRSCKIKAREVDYDW